MKDRGTLLTTTKEGALRAYPEEFRSSVVLTETTQAVPLNTEFVPTSPTILESELNQELQDERKLVKRSTVITGFSMHRRVVDDVYGIATDIISTVVSAVGSVSSVTVVAGGTGYTDGSVVTFSASALGDQARGIINVVAGAITSVTLTDPGSGYIANATISSITGGGTGANLTGIYVPTYQAVTPSGITGAVITAAGTGYPSNPPYTISGLGSGGAVTITVTAGVITNVVVSAAGSYAGTPVLTLTGVGGGSGGAIQLTIGTQAYNEIVPINKWHSVKISSQVDSTTLPIATSIPGTESISLPDILTGLTSEWGTGTTLGGVVGGGASASLSASVTGSVGVQIVGGFRGEAKARITETFFSYMPDITNIPNVTLIRPAYGTITIKEMDRSESAHIGSGTVANSLTVNLATKMVVVSGVLTNGVTLASPAIAITSGPVTITDAEGLSYTFSVTATGTMTSHLPVSTPTTFTSGGTITRRVILERWRLGIWLLRVVTLIIP